MKKINSDYVAAKIGTYIQYQRQKRELSLNEFAKLANITPSFLMRLENGVYQNIKFDAIEKLAASLQMTAEDFLRKCQVISSSEGLPPLEYYLKELYQFPEEAINDVMLFFSFIQEKYKNEIIEMKKAHTKFWKGKK